LQSKIPHYCIGEIPGIAKGPLKAGTHALYPLSVIQTLQGEGTEDAHNDPDQ